MNTPHRIRLQHKGNFSENTQAGFPFGKLSFDEIGPLVRSVWVDQEFHPVRLKEISSKAELTDQALLR